MSVVANVAINIDGKQAQGLLKAIQSEVEKLNGSFDEIPKRTKGIFGQLQNAATSAVGQLAAVTGAAFTLQKAFDTLAAQSKADAALRTLNVDAAAAGVAFRQLSTDLGGQASQVELTAAAYDVASAGFANVADQVTILNAATKGAVGGLSDLNTVGNAVTSVLNTYGMSASQATTLVDKFIQTQNDGKIVLAEYAGYIGRLAPTAAAAGVSIDEVNAAIASVTAQGVPVEATFTGLNQALVSILKPTKEASDLAAELGIDFSESGLRAKGFGGLLQEVARATGGSTTKITELFGSVDALKTVLPLVNDNLVSFDKNLQNQRNSTGTATKAFDDMRNSLGGAMKEVQSAFENLVVGFKPIMPAVIAPFKVLAVTLNTIATNLKGVAQAGVFLATFAGLMNAAALATKGWTIATQALAAAKKAAGVAAAFLQAVMNPINIAKIALALGVATGAAVALGKAMEGAGQKSGKARTDQESIKGITQQVNAEIQLQVGQLEQATTATNDLLKAQTARLQSVRDELSVHKANTLEIQNQLSALERGGTLTAKRYQAALAINGLEQQRLQRSYEQANTEQQRLVIATQLFRTQLQAAKIEYNQALETIKLEQQKLNLRLQLEQLKLKEIAAEADLQKLKASEIKDSDKRLEKEAEIDKKKADALASQQNVVDEVQRQIPAQKEIAEYEKQIAAAKFESQKLTAQTAFEQQLTTAEIGMSESAAVQLSQAIAANYTLTQGLRSEYSGVVIQIERAIAAQQRLNAARSGSNGSSTQPVQAFAAGGYVTRPTNAIVGEGGESEYVIPSSKMNAAMARYASGKRGESVIPQAAGDTSGSTERTAPMALQTASDTSGSSDYAPSINPMINVTTGPVMNMNGSNYVSQRDFIAGMQAASRRGAEMALSAMRNNGTIRRVVGAR